jgi:hypothetical protein
MEVLKSIRSEHIVAIDIETVRIAENFEDLSEAGQSAWEYRNKQNGKIPNYLELTKLWEETASLYAEFSQVCAVSMVYLSKEGVLVCKEFYGVDEFSILSGVATVLNDMAALFPDKVKVKYRLAGHASKFFDYPFISKRYLANRLTIPKSLDSTNMKPWEQINLCTNELWKMGGTGPGSSLQALCYVAKIETSKVDLVGDEVGKAFYKKEYSRIGRYCSLDAIATFNIIRWMKFEPTFMFKDVFYFEAYSEDLLKKLIEEKKEEVLIPEVPEILQVLEELHHTKKFAPKVTDHLKSKKILKKDLGRVKKLVLAHYKERVDVMATNKKELKEINDFREDEVNQFFKTL